MDGWTSWVIGGRTRMRDFADARSYATAAALEEMWELCHFNYIKLKNINNIKPGNLPPKDNPLYKLLNQKISLKLVSFCDRFPEPCLALISFVSKLIFYKEDGIFSLCLSQLVTGLLDCPFRGNWHWCCAWQLNGVSLPSNQLQTQTWQGQGLERGLKRWPTGADNLRLVSPYCVGLDGSVVSVSLSEACAPLGLGFQVQPPFCDSFGEPVEFHVSQLRQVPRPETRVPSPGANWEPRLPGEVVTNPIKTDSAVKEILDNI